MKEQTLTLRLPASILQWIESVRGERERSDYVVQLLEERMKQNRCEADERNRWLMQGREEYPAEVCRQTLQINDEFPIHQEMYVHQGCSH